MSRPNQLSRGDEAKNDDFDEMSELVKSIQEEIKELKAQESDQRIRAYIKNLMRFKQETGIAGKGNDSLEQYELSGYKAF